MPVPVPLTSKPPAHPVIKPTTRQRDVPVSFFHNFPHTLPVSPVGPPPSFGTREEWINSLPTWRRTKPRRIWEDDKPQLERRPEQCFQKGLTVAGNASVIKGAHAEACIPPLRTLFDPNLLSIGVTPDLAHASEGDSDDEMSSDCSVLDPALFDNSSQWSATSPAVGHHGNSASAHSGLHYPHNLPGTVTYERGAFTPVFEDESPGATSGHELGSSPLEPVTPFGEFVDRAVATTQPDVAFDNVYYNDAPQHISSNQDSFCGPQCYPPPQHQAPAQEPVKEQAPALDVVIPTASANYRKLTEPLSEWVANYVWKVCTTGLSLPSLFAQPSYPSMPFPPAHLATSIHSLLLSTLLQPSAVILAIWYIVRLPVYFSGAELPEQYLKESVFRHALFENLDQDGIEANVPFRLVVLGCMLANKWLDDHTFSNKTWHTISNIHISTLNRLEFLALEIFQHNLSISPAEWTEWLTHIISYHMSLAPPPHIQPIGRPSSNPHSIVRRAFDEIIQAPVACNGASVPQPCFLGLEERMREKAERERAIEVDEIDLDKDGPLREEYLPRRRGTGSSRTSISVTSSTGSSSWDGHVVGDLVNRLPPPAKWSPAADEPILREHRGKGHYVTAQAPYMAPVAAFIPSYPPMHDGGYQLSDWHGGHGATKQLPPAPGYPFDYPQFHIPSQPVYNPYNMMPTHNPYPHVRTQSLPYDQDFTQPRNHMRAYSQAARFDYQYSDIRMTANELAPHHEVDSRWSSTGQHYMYPNVAPNFGTQVPNFSASWIRT
ncbi:hypothetical protein BDN72DRAFT_759726 [Pluteus cervinus]|uniref:Uncharacterized protein n=1 Tax=Pluteus cervinus TaxID=181527 RepID=A0ACD3B8P3_9AGAR|nr:hypothetical protein BDN72DRAFT_759726 [Pluteus cervinus]